MIKRFFDKPVTFLGLCMTLFVIEAIDGIYKIVGIYMNWGQ